jgi:hypothetical protein
MNGIGKVLPESKIQGRNESPGQVTSSQVPDTMVGMDPPTGKPSYEDLGRALHSAIKYIETVNVYKRRMEWLHQGGGTDPEGYEWGVARVKFVNGNPVSVLWTLSDHSDLDAEMARASQR